MAKCVDITNKLTFDGNPYLVIKDKKLEVNADAPTMLKVMGLVGNDDPGFKEIAEAYGMIFPDKSRQELEKMKLQFNDLLTVIREAIDLVTGGGEEPREE